MANVKLDWDVPLTRESGRPLKPEQIGGYIIEVSHDGKEFVRQLDAAPNVTERLFTALDAGVYRFRVAPFDTKNKEGAFAEATIEIDDDTPPSAVLNLSVTIDVSIPTSQG